MAAARLKVLRPPRCVISLETAALELPAAGLPSRRAARSQVAPPESPARIRLSRRKRPLARSPFFRIASGKLIYQAQSLGVLLRAGVSGNLQAKSFARAKDVLLAGPGTANPH